MGDKSKIEWTEATWTPIRARATTLQRDGSWKERIGWHCTHASPGCVNCYAESINLRLGTGLKFLPTNLYDPARHSVAEGKAELFLDERTLLAPLRWMPGRMIFVCSMTDLFADFVPDDWIDRIFAVMALCPQHTFQVLTKRPERAVKYFGGGPGIGWGDRNSKVTTAAREIARQSGSGLPEHWRAIGAGRVNHIWFGASAEDQRRWEERRKALLMVGGWLGGAFLSAEPLLGSIDLDFRFDHCDLCGGTGKLARWPNGKCHVCGGRGQVLINGAPDRRGYHHLKWVIVGGESGPGARGCYIPHVRSIVRQCAMAHIPVFVKQLGGFVTDRNDAGFDGCDPCSWPEEFDDGSRVEHDINGFREDYQGAPVRIRLHHKKGADLAEWPADLRVRDMPKVTP